MDLLGELGVEDRELAVHLTIIPLSRSLQLCDQLWIVQVLLCIRPSSIVVVAWECSRITKGHVLT